MVQQPSPIYFEDVPLDEARRLGRGPRMDPQLYQALTERIQSLSYTAVRMTISEGTSQNAMKNRLHRIAAELGVPVTIRRVPGGLVFWRSTDEDIQQAKEVGARLQSRRRKRDAGTRGRQRRATR